MLQCGGGLWGRAVCFQAAHGQRIVHTVGIWMGSYKNGLVACGSNGNGKTAGLDDLVGHF